MLRDLFPLIPRNLVAFILLLVFSGLASQSVFAGEILLKVKAGDQGRNNAVVSFPLPEDLQDADNLLLVQIGHEKQIPVQVDRTQSPPRAVWIIQKFPAGETRDYRLTIGGEKQNTVNTVSVKDDGKHLVVTVGEKTVLSYNHAVMESPIKGAPFYKRSGYIHPVYSPTGEMITDDFNPDHAHQHGIMFSWRKMKFRGRITDTWNQIKNKGRVEHVSIESIGSGPVFGFFKVKLKHVDLTGSAGPETMLYETWTIKIYAVGDGFLFDLVSKQECASESPVTIEKIHYGGMAIRGAAYWFDHQSFGFQTSEGKTKIDGNHSRPQWVTMAGPLKKGVSSVTIFSHKENYRSPQPVRLHPKMPYFCFNPSVFDSFQIVPNKPYVSRFRFYVHEGKQDSKVLDKIFAGYVHPVQAEVIKN